MHKKGSFGSLDYNGNILTILTFSMSCTHKGEFPLLRTSLSNIQLVDFLCKILDRSLFTMYTLSFIPIFSSI